jgi:hypothetical protein
MRPCFFLLNSSKLQHCEFCLSGKHGTVPQLCIALHGTDLHCRILRHGYSHVFPPQFRSRIVDGDPGRPSELYTAAATAAATAATAAATTAATTSASRRSRDRRKFVWGRNRHTR